MRLPEVSIPNGPSPALSRPGRDDYTKAMITTELKIQLLSPLATTPAYHSDGAAGLDLHAAISEPVTIKPGSIKMIPIGLAIELTPGFEAQVRPRSGLASRHGITLPNSPGTIDADYRGEVCVPLINLGSDPFEVEPGMRVAQMVIAPVARAVITETESLCETARGKDGFGSTGV